MSNDTAKCEPMAVIARCKCGGIVYAAVKCPEAMKSIAKELGRLLMRGFVIGEMSVDEVRTATWCSKSAEHMREKS
jgi:hypothetical protein